MNVELARHINSILVHPKGTVVMRTNRLGVFEGVSEILAGDRDDLDALDPGEDDGNGKPIRRRALARRRTTGSGDTSSLAKPDGLIEQDVALPEKWIDEAIFQMPERTSWARDHAEGVFQRRQEAKLSYAELGEEFGVTGPTARAAVLCYLDEHPEAKDEVNLPRGGKRPPKFDLSKFGHEARALWESGWAKVKLAVKYGCSEPTIDKAIQWSYQQEGRSAPTRKQRMEAKAQSARELLDAGHSLEEISQALDVSDVTARKYLCESFAAEGKPMPDLRRRSS